MGLWQRQRRLSFARLIFSLFFSFFSLFFFLAEIHCSFSLRFFVSFFFFSVRRGDSIASAKKGGAILTMSMSTTDSKKNATAGQGLV